MFPSDPVLPRRSQAPGLAWLKLVALALAASCVWKLRLTSRLPWK